VKSPLTQSVSYRPLIYSLARDIALNATIPVACYYLSKTFISPSELTALILATIFPTLKSIYDVTRHRAINPVSVLVLLGIVTGIIALFVGGDPRVLLIRESLFTGVFGLARLVSLLFRRPMMFYFGRYFMAGNDSEKRHKFESGWDVPTIRRGHRLITTVWGFVYLGEFVIRVILVYTQPAAVVLAVTPFVLGSATILTIIWTFRYVHKLRGRIGQYPLQRS
jgi:hypothetical protein